MVHRDPSYWISGLCITSSTPRPHFQRIAWDHLWNIEILGGVASVKGTWDRKKMKNSGGNTEKTSKRYSHHYHYSWTSVNQSQWWRRLCSSPSKGLKPADAITFTNSDSGKRDLLPPLSKLSCRLAFFSSPIVMGELSLETAVYHCIMESSFPPDIYHVQITPKLHPCNGGKWHPLFGGMLLPGTSPQTHCGRWQGSTICDLWSQVQIQVGQNHP